MNSVGPNSKDRELCLRYIDDLRRQGLSPHEPWELQLEIWAEDQEHLPSHSTLRRLRLHFPDRR